MGSDWIDKDTASDVFGGGLEAGNSGLFGNVTIGLTKDTASDVFADGGLEAGNSGLFGNVTIGLTKDTASDVSTGFLFKPAVSPSTPLFDDELKDSIAFVGFTSTLSPLFCFGISCDSCLGEMVLLLRQQPLFLEVTHVVKMKPMPSYGAALGVALGRLWGWLWGWLPSFFHSGNITMFIYSFHSWHRACGGGGVGTESVSSVFGGGGAALGGGSPSVDAIMLDVRRKVLYSA